MKNNTILITLLLLSGCSTFERHMQKENPKNVLHANWNEKVASDFISGNYSKKYDELECLSVPQKATAERNKQLDRFLIGVDTYYYKNKNALITGRGINDTTSDIIQLGLTGTASFASGGTANVLAAVATALNGAKLSIDKNLFADKSPLLIVSKMEQIRLSKLNQINKNRLLDCNYSLNSAMKDALEYYYLGTVNGALLALFTDTGEKMQKAQSEETTIVKENYELAINKHKAETTKKELDNQERKLNLKK